MKPIKMFGLTALAALLAMAFVGASSAVAENTALCKAEEESCSAANTISHVHETSVGKGVLKSKLPTIECTVLFLGDVQPADSPALHISGQFTYTNCNNFCKVKEETPSASIEVLKTASELASVTGEGLVNVSCPFINCNYVGTGLEGHALGPLTSSQANGSVVLTEQNTEKESGSCPEEAFLTLTTTPLEKAYLSKWKGYCVKTLHENGLFTNSNCSTLGSSPPTHKYEYTLVWAPVGWGKEGVTRCYDTLSHRALYDKFSNLSSPCAEDKDQEDLAWLYEDGEITEVE
jgi:hypothetical protein